MTDSSFAATPARAHASDEAALAARLASPDAAVRRVALFELADLEDPGFVPAFIAALRADPSPDVRAEAARVLGAWEQPDVVDALCGALLDPDDDVRAAKPDPAGLLAAADALGIAPARAVYIGDTVSDMRAGRNAGMRIGAALWAKTAPGEQDAFLRSTQSTAPDWTFERPADVTRAFAPWC